MLHWTTIIDTAISTVPAIIAALYARSVHTQVKTPSGKPLGQVAEYAHDTAIANNLLLANGAGQTQQADTETLHELGATPPQIPASEDV